MRVIEILSFSIHLQLLDVERTVLINSTSMGSGLIIVLLFQIMLMSTSIIYLKPSLAMTFKAKFITWIV